MSLSDGAIVVTAVATWVLALATILYTRRSWEEQRELAYENWLREQVARLVVLLRSNRDRLDRLAMNFEAELADRKLFSPAASFLERKRKECDAVKEVVDAMRLDAAML